MGIKGLHDATKLHKRKAHISSYRGKRIGVDASVLLMKVLAGKPEISWNLHSDPDYYKTTGNGHLPWVKYFVTRIMVLRQVYKVELCFVFDGQRATAKSDTNAARLKTKEKNLQKARTLIYEAGIEQDEKVKQDKREEANKLLRAAIAPTPQMVYDIIAALKKHNVQYVVAPYEADPQLAYLSKLPRERGGVDAVATVDSDLIAYGCPRILFNLNLNNPTSDEFGQCDELEVPRLFTCLPPTPPPEPVASGGKAKRVKPATDFRKWTQDMLLHVCVLAGCDYFKLNGIAFCKAFKCFNTTKCLATSLDELKASNEQKQQAWSAVAAFKHALVYDIDEKRCVRLLPIGEAPEIPAESLEFLNQEQLSDDVAHLIARGWLNPRTMHPFDSHTPPPDPNFTSLAAEAAVAAAAATAAEQLADDREALVAAQEQTLTAPVSDEFYDIGDAVEVNSCKCEPCVEQRTPPPRERQEAVPPSTSQPLCREEAERAKKPKLSNGNIATWSQQRNSERNTQMFEWIDY